MQGSESLNPFVILQAFTSFHASMVSPTAQFHNNPFDILDLSKIKDERNIQDDTAFKLLNQLDSSGVDEAEWYCKAIVYSASSETYMHATVLSLMLWTKKPPIDLARCVNTALSIVLLHVVEPIHYSPEMAKIEVYRDLFELYNNTESKDLLVRILQIEPSPETDFPIWFYVTTIQCLTSIYHFTIEDISKVMPPFKDKAHYVHIKKLVPALWS